MLFELAAKDYEEYSPRLFEGNPMTNAEWKALCDSLWPMAVMRAIYHDNGYIGVSDVVSEIEVLLKQQGFTLVMPVAHSYFGGSNIMTGSDLNALPFDFETRTMVQERNGQISARVLREATALTHER